jgi:hypothetical protein
MLNLLWLDHALEPDCPYTHLAFLDTRMCIVIFIWFILIREMVCHILFLDKRMFLDILLPKRMVYCTAFVL